MANTVCSLGPVNILYTRTKCSVQLFNDAPARENGICSSLDAHNSNQHWNWDSLPTWPRTTKHQLIAIETNWMLDDAFFARRAVYDVLRAINLEVYEQQTSKTTMEWVFIRRKPHSISPKQWSVRLTRLSPLRCKESERKRDTCEMLLLLLLFRLRFAAFWVLGRIEQMRTVSYDGGVRAAYFFLY